MEPEENTDAKIEFLNERIKFLREESGDIYQAAISMMEYLEHNAKVLVNLAECHKKYTNEMYDQFNDLQVELKNKCIPKYQTGTYMTSTQTQEEEEENRSTEKTVPEINMQVLTQVRSDDGPREDERTEPRMDRGSKVKNTGDRSTRSTKIIKIRADEDLSPLSAKEEEYSKFAEWVYRMENNDHCFKSPGNHTYPRIVCLEGINPNLVSKLANFGFLDLIYPGLGLRELDAFDEIFKIKVSEFARGRRIYLKFYSISPEFEDNIDYQAQHVISIGHVAANFSMECGTDTSPIPRITRKWIKSRRALGIKAVHGISKNLFERRFRVICQFSNYTIATQGGADKSSILEELINNFQIHAFPPCSETTRREACAIMQCPTCNGKNNETPSIMTPRTMDQLRKIALKNVM
ncbi:uncharacterized protein LOC133816921 [Humulus lupulus]|uniref:uncharacterized protein LOC133816921 n=1 Tax=Humulus lupulus TaxID=3486 RepID=UPI002B4160E0|nr:uncharacterized protein LOC133816921 [Humulus lupulus]